MAAGFYLASKRIAPNEWRADVTVDGVGPLTITMPVPTRAYIHDGPGGDFLTSFVTQLDTQLEAAFVAPNEDFTLAFSPSSMKLLISCTTGTIDLWNWNVGVYGTGFRDWCGFTGNFSAVTSATGQNPMQGIIVTKSGRTRDSDIRRDYTGETSVARSGKLASMTSDTVRTWRKWDHTIEPDGFSASPLMSGVYDRTSVVVPWVWDDFIAHQNRKGNLPFRFYETVGAAIGLYEDTYTIHEALLGRWDPEKTEANNKTWWTVPMHVRSFPVPT